VARSSLSGKRIAVTRASEQVAELKHLLEARGAQVWEVPVIRFAPPSDPARLEQALSHLLAFDWIVFTSANGVRWASRALGKLDQDLASLRRCAVAAVGEATAATLRQEGIEPALVPAEAMGASLAAALLTRQPRPRRVLLLRAETGTPALVNALKAAGIEVEDVAVYRTETNMDLDPQVLAPVRSGLVDAFAFASPSAARSLVKLLGTDGVKMVNRSRIACIGPTTAAACQELGLRVDAIACIQSLEGLVAALEECFAS